jgi:pilus assembly protein CpaB
LKKISKNTVLLGGAVVLGVLCFVGAQSYFRNYLANAEKELASSYEKKKVIVAKREIAPGEAVSVDNLAVREIPKRYLASTALAPEELEQVEGQKLVVGMKPGDPIDRGALERSDRAALSTTVEKGERAITFPVDEVSSISGMLVPGDVIDLMFTGPGTTENSYRNGEVKELTHVRALLEAVPVIATGKTTQTRTVRTPGGESQEVNMDFTTVTLKVTPEQAEQVLLGQKLGQLTAVLRNPADQGVRARHAVLDEAVFKRVGGGPAAAAGRGNFVEMIIGGTGSMGGTRVEAEVGRELGKGLVAALAPQSAAPAGAKAADAGDVRSRLGIAAPPAAPSSSNRINH